MSNKNVIGKRAMTSRSSSRSLSPASSVYSAGGGFRRRRRSGSAGRSKLFFLLFLDLIYLLPFKFYMPNVSRKEFGQNEKSRRRSSFY
jgi:hypothetical protein